MVKTGEPAEDSGRLNTIKSAVSPMHKMEFTRFFYLDKTNASTD